jgi:PAS domain S-box-containing protein
MTHQSLDRTSPESVSQTDERFRLLVEGVTDYAIFMLDPQGHVLTWNTGAARIKGYRPDEIIGQHFSKFYPPEAKNRHLPEHELRVAGAEGRFEDEGWRVRKDGTRFWANVVITALRDDAGELRGFAKVTRDLTQRREHEEVLRQSEERFRLLVEGVSDYAIFMLDANGYVMTWNSGARRIKGYFADEIIGQHFSKFYPADAVESGWPEHELQVAIEQAMILLIELMDTMDHGANYRAIFSCRPQVGSPSERSDFEQLIGKSSFIMSATQCLLLFVVVY